MLLVNFLYLKGQNGKSLCSSCKFLGYSVSTSNKYLLSLVSSSYSIMVLVVKKSFGLSIHLKLFNGNFLHIAQPYKLFASRYIKRDDF